MYLNIQPAKRPQSWRLVVSSLWHRPVCFETRICRESMRDRCQVNPKDDGNAAFHLWKWAVDIMGWKKKISYFSFTFGFFSVYPQREYLTREFPSFYGSETRKSTSALKIKRMAETRTSRIRRKIARQTRLGRKKGETQIEFVWVVVDVPLSCGFWLWSTWAIKSHHSTDTSPELTLSQVNFGAHSPTDR